MKRILAFGIIAAVGLLLGVMWLLPGAFSAKGKPPEWEISMARFARHLATPSQWRDATNPVEASSENLADALHHFADHCASCHANDGSGKTPMGPNFYPPVPDLRTETIQSMSDGELFYVIHFGVRFTGMPAWGDGNPEKDTESWTLVHFVRHLPNISPEEIAQMKAMNPMTAEERAEQAAIDAFLAGEDFAPPAEHHH
jgi:mono/diheme cytochrome c family protein